MTLRIALGLCIVTAAQWAIAAPPPAPSAAAPASEPEIPLLEPGLWTFEVENTDALPRSYMIPDEKKIREAVRLGIREIAGVKIFQKEQIRI